MIQEILSIIQKLVSDNPDWTESKVAKPRKKVTYENLFHFTPINHINHISNCYMSQNHLDSRYRNNIIYWSLSIYLPKVLTNLIIELYWSLEYYQPHLPKELKYKFRGATGRSLPWSLCIEYFKSSRTHSIIIYQRRLNRLFLRFKQREFYSLWDYSKRDKILYP